MFTTPHPHPPTRVSGPTHAHAAESLRRARRYADHSPLPCQTATTLIVCTPPAHAGTDAYAPAGDQDRTWLWQQEGDGPAEEAREPQPERIQGASVRAPVCVGT
jgi:hypothetical protein